MLQLVVNFSSWSKKHVPVSLLALLFAPFSITPQVLHNRLSLNTTLTRQACKAWEL